MADRPSYQALVDPLQSDESAESKQESIAAPVSQQKEQNSAAQNSVPVQTQFDSQSTPIQIKLPLQLDFDEIAGVSIRILYKGCPKKLSSSAVWRDLSDIYGASSERVFQYALNDTKTKCVW